MLTLCNQRSNLSVMNLHHLQPMTQQNHPGIYKGPIIRYSQRVGECDCENQTGCTWRSQADWLLSVYFPSYPTILLKFRLGMEVAAILTTGSVMVCLLPNTRQNKGTINFIRVACNE